VFLRRVYRAHNIEELMIEEDEEEGEEGEGEEGEKLLKVADFTFRFRDTPPAQAPLRRGQFVVVQSLAGIEANIDKVTTTQCFLKWSGSGRSLNGP
jgi:hypothetical protein